jgi:hypothetical protein
MTDAPEGNVTPIDPEVRQTIEEFSANPLALAAEIVRLRAELADALEASSRAPMEVILPKPSMPPGTPPPTRLER